VDLIVRRKLGEARWRLTVQRFLHLGAWALVAGLSLVFVWHGAGLFSPAIRAWPVSSVVALGAAPLLAAVGLALLGWRSNVDVAREVDVRAATRDRFLTVLQLDRNETSSLTKAIQTEVATFASRLQLKEYLRWKFPVRKLLWLLVPLAGLAGTELFRNWREGRPEVAEARQIVEKARIAADDHARQNPEFEKVVRELEIARDRLPDSTEPLRDALRALAELEQKLSAAPGGPAALSSGEASALAEAVAGGHPKLAADLRSGHTTDAAEGVGQMDPDALAKALAEAARHVENSRLRELARQDGAQAQKQLVSMLQNSGGPGGDSARRKFLSELSDIKSGTQAANGETEGGKDGEAGKSPDGSEKSAPAQADNAPPGGGAGSEKDLGRGADLAGEADPGQDVRAIEEFVPGQAGEGGSLVELFRTAGGDDPNAAQAYRSAYRSALPAALDAVNKEEIPSGSRLLVRRYFESIRPKE